MNGERRLISQYILGHGRAALRSHVAAVAALLLLGALAFVHLMALPVFEDEGSQLRLISRVVDAGEWLQPLAEGKPLEIWPMGLVARLTPHPLPGIRALHVLAGLIGAVLTYRLALLIVDRRTAFVSAALFAICPFVVYLERIALSEILLCAAGVWVLLSILRLLASPTWPRAAAFAASLVLAAFCKFPVGFVFMTAMPLMLLFMPCGERRTLLHRPVFTRVLAAYLPVVLLVLTVACVALIQVRRGHAPGFGLEDFIGIGLGGYRDIAGVIGVPRPNVIGELTTQLSWPVFVIGVIGLGASALLNDWRQRWLIAVGGLPLLAIGTLANFWFPRYLLFTLPPLVVCAVSGWHSLALRAQRFQIALEIALLAVCVVFMGRQSLLIISNPPAAHWSPLDRFQYFEGWSSGYGYPEAAQFMVTTPAAPETTYSLDGHSAYQLRTYLPAAWSRRVVPIFYDEQGRALRTERERLANLFTHAPVWIVVSEQLLSGYMNSSFGRAGAQQIAMRRVAVFPKPGSRARLAIYEATKR